MFKLWHFCAFKFHCRTCRTCWASSMISAGSWISWSRKTVAPGWSLKMFTQVDRCSPRWIGGNGSPATASTSTTYHGHPTLQDGGSTSPPPPKKTPQLIEGNGSTKKLPTTFSQALFEIPPEQYPPSQNNLWNINSCIVINLTSHHLTSDQLYSRHLRVFIAQVSPKSFPQLDCNWPSLPWPVATCIRYKLQICLYPKVNS